MLQQPLRINRSNVNIVNVIMCLDAIHVYIRRLCVASRIRDMPTYDVVWPYVCTLRRAIRTIRQSRRAVGGKKQPKLRATLYSLLNGIKLLRIFSLFMDTDALQWPRMPMTVCAFHVTFASLRLCRISDVTLMVQILKPPEYGRKFQARNSKPISLGFRAISLIVRRAGRICSDVVH